MASDSVLIASTAESDSKDGVVQLAEFILNLHKRAHKGLTIDGILLCMIDERLKLNKKIIAELSAFFDNVIPVYYTKVVRRVELATAKDMQKTIFEYLPHSQSAVSYTEICHEFLEKGGYVYGKEHTA